MKCSSDQFTAVKKNLLFELRPGHFHNLTLLCRNKKPCDTLLSTKYTSFISFRLTGKEKRIGGFDLIWNDGPVTIDDIGAGDCLPAASFSSNSFLGEFIIFTTILNSALSVHYKWRLLNLFILSYN